jgi:hypothetical protein
MSKGGLGLETFSSSSHRILAAKSKLIPTESVVSPLPSQLIITNDHVHSNNGVSKYPRIAVQGFIITNDHNESQNDHTVPTG